MIAEVIILMFANAGVSDSVDLMRAHILGMEIERVDHTVDSIKSTSAYLGCHYDIPFNDIFLQSLLDKASSLKSQ